MCGNLSTNRCLSIMLVAFGVSHVQDGYMHRVLEMASALQQKGHIVRILWFFPLRHVLKRGSFCLGGYKGCAFIALPTLPGLRFAAFQYISRTVTAILVRLICALLKVDVIQAENSTPALFATKAMKPLVIDFHGDVMAERKYQESKVSRKTHDHLIRQETYLLKRAASILCVSHNLYEVLRSRQSYLPRVNIAPCGVKIERFDSGISQRDKQRQDLGISKRIVLCYMGSLHAWQHVHETIALISQLRQLDRRVFFLLLTQYSVSYIEKDLLSIGQPAVDFLHLSLSRDGISKVLPAADVGFLLRRSSPVNFVASPTKCGEYLAAGVPVVTTVHAGDASSVIEKTGAGFVIEDIFPTSQEFKSLVSLVNNIQANRAHWQNTARNAARQFCSWDATTEALDSVYARF